MSCNNSQISSQQGFHGFLESLRVGTRKAWQGFSTHCLKLTETKDIFGITHDVTMVLTSLCPGVFKVYSVVPQMVFVIKMTTLW